MQVIPSPQDCCSPCETPTTTSVPGPQGAAGDDGADGTDGVNAYTTVANYTPASQPVMPAEGATVVVNVTSDTGWFAIGATVFVQNWGTMLVTAIPSSSSVTLQNLENTASGLYPDNAAPGTSLAAASRIVPTGRQGVAGTTPAGALLVANNLSDLNDVATARTNLGLGDASGATLGVGNGEVAPNDGALTAGDAVFATASGIETQVASDARTSLGLGTMATQNAGAVNISGGALNGTLGATVPATASVTTFNASGAVVFSSTLGVAGATTLSGPLFTPSSAIQTLAAGNTISPNARKARVAGSGGAVTLTSTPTITNPAADGQDLIIMGTSDVNTITLQDKSALGGSNLNLAGGANVTLGEGDLIHLIWDSTLAGWYELSRSNN